MRLRAEVDEYIEQVCCSLIYKLEVINSLNYFKWYVSIVIILFTMTVYRDDNINY